MSRVPSDPDDDDIKRILESMWEKTSRDDSESSTSKNRRTFIGIDLEARDVTEESESSHTDAGETEDGSPRRRRLIDALNDVEPGDPSNEAGASDDDADIHHQLSSLTYKGNGRDSAGSETPMHTQFGQNPDSKLNNANGHAQDVSSSDQENARGAGDGSGPLGRDTPAAAPTASADQSDHSKAPNPPQPTTEGEPKRKMASFFDQRMTKMASAADEGLPPAAKPAAPPPQPQQQAAPPPQTPAQATPPPASTLPAVTDAKSGDASHETAAELMRPVLRQWLGENMPKIVESALQIEAAQSSNPGDTKKTGN